MTNEELDCIVLRIASTQSPGYLLSPFSSAFLAADLKSEDVEMSLARLESQGHTKFTRVTEPMVYEEGTYVRDEDGDPVFEDGELLTHGPDDPVLDDNGEQITWLHEEGWEITAKGEGEAKALPTLDELVVPVELPRAADVLAEEREKRAAEAIGRIQGNATLPDDVKAALSDVVRSLLT